jgi:hypothetical protein
VKTSAIAENGTLGWRIPMAAVSATGMRDSDAATNSMIGVGGHESLAGMIDNYHDQGSCLAA